MKRGKKKMKNRSRSQNPMVPVLREIRENTLDSAHFMPPSRRDVQKLHIVRDRSYTVLHTHQSTGITTSTTIEVDYVYDFQLNLLNDYTSYQVVFDKYRVLQVTLDFVPRFEANSGLPALITAIDTTDANTLTYAKLLDYDTAQFNSPGAFFSRTWNPRAALAAFAGAFTSYAVAPSTLWYDTQSPGVQFYGLKAAIPVASVAQTIFDVFAHVTIQFKNSI